jgi:chlorobactene glucosyltransferase
MLNILAEVLSPYYYYMLLVVATYFFIFSLANHYEMWRFTRSPVIFDGPLVSVLIPMRNEEENVENCLNGLRDQLYKNYEILVLNDNSTDRTGEILERIAAEDPRVKVINGKPLPVDWFGKPYALYQLTNEAKGDLLLFTDADTVHYPASISWAVTNLQLLKTDMLSGYIGQIFKTFGEIVTVPLMFFLTGFFIPLFLNRYTKLHFFSAAIGQFIMIRREVFNAIGGCESFKNKTSEDIYMARAVKKKGYSTRFLSIIEHVQCRMYDGYKSAMQGIGKNIFDFLGKRTWLLFVLAILIFFFLFFPFPLLIGAIIVSSPWLKHILLINILYTLTWLFMLLGQRLNWMSAFLWPLMYLNLIYMAMWSWIRTISGKGFVWKDRKVN